MLRPALNGMGKKPRPCQPVSSLVPVPAQTAARARRRDRFLAGGTRIRTIGPALAKGFCRVLPKGDSGSNGWVPY